MVFYGATDAAPAIPATESTLGSHPCVALSSAQLLPEWINRNLVGNRFSANGGNPLTLCLTPGVHFIQPLRLRLQSLPFLALVGYLRIVHRDVLSGRLVGSREITRSASNSGTPDCQSIVRLSG